MSIVTHSAESGEAVDLHISGSTDVEIADGNYDLGKRARHALRGIAFRERGRGIESEKLENGFDSSFDALGARQHFLF